MLYLEGAEVPVTVFPDNTSQVWHLDPVVLLGCVERAARGSLVTVRWEFSNEGELLRLVQLFDLLRAYGISSEEVSLVMPYLPYGRQDKVVSNNATFALESFERVLALVNPSKITVLDPHSECALERFSVQRIYPSALVDAIFKSGEYDLVCYPDKGAETKYSAHYGNTTFQREGRVVAGYKVRDPQTGDIIITGLRVPSGVTLADARVLVVDDICDGGATFLAIAEVLRGAGAESLGLFTTHGLYTKGISQLSETFDAGLSCYRGVPFSVDGAVGFTHYAAELQKIRDEVLP